MSGAAHPAMARTAPPIATGKRQQGFLFLALLIVIATMGVGLAAVGSLWHEAQKRAKERELLFVGTQYRRAIQQYYETSPGGKKYPPTLEALLLDERTPSIRRHLRRPYRDPLTNGAAWGLVNAPQGGIMGIYSLSDGKPVKQANFPAQLNWEGGKTTYADWQFVYVPAATTLPAR